MIGSSLNRPDERVASFRRAGACMLPALLLACQAAAVTPDDICGDAVRILGTDASDLLDGEAENECLIGKGGRDLLSGGPGNDVLHGGAGSDTLLGGPGDDVFVVGLGDHSVVIADTDGVDTIRFGPDVTPDMIAAGTPGGVFTIQIDSQDRWTYVMLEPGNPPDEVVVESLLLANGERYTPQEFLSVVSNDVLTVEQLQQRVIRDMTVDVSEAKPDIELHDAVATTLRTTGRADLCLSPPLSPLPAEYGRWSDRSGPEQYYYVFVGEPGNEREARQRAQFDALTAAGIMRAERGRSDDGSLSTRYSLTMDGWAHLNERSCIHYGQLGLERVDSYMQTGRTNRNAELILVKAGVVAANVESWAKEPGVKAQFQEVSDFQDGVTLEVFVYRKDGQWLPADRNNSPIPETVDLSFDIPDERQLMDLPRRDRPGTLGRSEICVGLPILQGERFDHPDTPYLTYGLDRYPDPDRTGYRDRRDYLDMLVSIGAATMRQRIEQDARGSSRPFVEYRLAPQVRIARGPAGFECLVVADAELTPMTIRKAREFHVVVRGQETVVAAYPWVRDPKFLAEHEEVAQALQGPNPVIAKVLAAPGYDPKLMSVFTAQRQ